MDKEEKVRIIAEVEKTLQKMDDIFDNRLVLISNMDKKRIEIEDALIKNKYVLQDSNSKLMRFIARVYNENKGDFLLFLRSLRTKMPWIQSFRNESSDTILKQLGRTQVEFGDEKHFSILIDLYNLIIKAKLKGEKEKPVDTGFLIGFIKTEANRNAIDAAIGEIRNRKVEEQIRKAIHNLTNEELGYLLRYTSEVQSWNSKEAIKEEIQFFISRTLLFLNGQKGLVSYFKDERLEKMMRTNAIFLQLMNYNRQILYLEQLRAKIFSYQTGEWNQFEEVYKNIEKIAMVLINKFGNTGLASYLVKEKKTIGEYPERWFLDLTQKINEMRSPEYRRRIIVQFAREIEKIFILRMEELRKSQEPQISDLLNALNPLIKLEKNAAGKILDEIMDIKKKNESRLKELRNEFEILSDKCSDGLYSFIVEKNRLIDKDITDRIRNLLNNALSNSRKEQKILDFAAKTSGSNLTFSSVWLLVAFDKLAKATEAISKNEQELLVMFTREDVINKIEQLSAKMRDVEMAYNILNNFITSRLIQLTLISNVKGEVNSDGRISTAASHDAKVHSEKVKQYNPSQEEQYRMAG